VPLLVTAKLLPEAIVTPVIYLVSVAAELAAAIVKLLSVATSPVGTYPAVDTLALIDKLDTDPLPVPVTETPLVSLVLHVSVLDLLRLTVGVIEPPVLETANTAAVTGKNLSTVVEAAVNV